VFISILYSFVQ